MIYLDNKGKFALIFSVTFVMLLAVMLVFAAPGGKSGQGGGGPKECNDKIDNDGDGNIDWPDDAGCQNKQDDDESNCGDNVCEGGETYSTCSLDCTPPDSCTDTDGTDEYTYGSVSGYSSGSPYTYYDGCVDSDHVAEQICSGTNPSITSIYCGDDVSIDYCLGSDVYTNTTNNGCTSGVCTADTSSVLKESCEFGCNSGECLAEPDSCIDSDGGINYVVAGNTTGALNESGYNNYDFCSGQILTEFYCSGDYSQSTNIDCGSNEFVQYCDGNYLVTNETTRGCAAGACIQDNQVDYTYCMYGCSASACNSPQPDLVVSNIDFNLYPDNSTNVTVLVVDTYVKNIGNGTADSSITNTSFSGNYNEHPIGSLSSGQEAYITDVYNCSSISYFIAFADKDDNVVESIEYNNAGFELISC